MDPDTHPAAKVQPLPARPKSPPREVLFRVTFWIVVVGSGVAFVTRFLQLGLPLQLDVMWLVFLVTVVVGLIIAYRSGRRAAVKSFLASHAGFVCPRCHFGLSGLPDDAVCPECGTQAPRSAVVALWENAFGLPPRYSRTQQRLTPSPVRANTPIVPQSPWQTWSLKAAMELIEKGAAERGFAGVRTPQDSVSFDAPLVGKRPLPSELYTFLAWSDPRQWRAFVAPASIAQSEAGPSIVLRSSARLQTATVAELAASSSLLAAFVASLAQQGRNPDWVNTQLIAIADTHDSRVIFYATDPPDAPRGSLVHFNSSGRVVVLAVGLAQWLTRLAACKGVDGVLFPELLPLVPEGPRAFLVSEFGLQTGT